MAANVFQHASHPSGILEINPKVSESGLYQDVNVTRAFGTAAEARPSRHGWTRNSSLSLIIAASVPGDISIAVRRRVDEAA
jgi:hypothetical protein